MNGSLKPTMTLNCAKKQPGGSGAKIAPLAFETCAWIFEKEIATICSDTWGIEVRPNETDELGQPLHWVTIPAIGVTHGEMFFLKDLAADCAADHTYEFFFAAPPLNITPSLLDEGLTLLEEALRD